MDKLKKILTDKTTIAGIVILIILAVVWSNMDKIKAWFAPKDDAKDDEKGKDSSEDKDKPPATNTPATPPAKFDYNLKLEFKSPAMQNKTVTLLQHMLNKHIEKLELEPVTPPLQTPLQKAGLEAGARLKTDGIFGSKTQDYLKKLTGLDAGTINEIRPKLSVTPLEEATLRAIIF